MTIKIRPASADDLPVAIELLRAASLPTEDLSAELLALTAEIDGVVQGIVGVENFGRTALLRSLVIDAAARGTGIGSLLVAALESECTDAGVTELWLLTIDAQRFFERHDYEVRLRQQAPEAIRNTPEFSSLCPDDAALMCKKLG